MFLAILELVPNRHWAGSWNRGAAINAAAAAEKVSAISFDGRMGRHI
jgi:hypothetical protein